VSNALTDHLRLSQMNFFAAGPMDRLAGVRRDPGWQAEAVTHPGARFVPVWRDRSLLWRMAAAGACLLPAGHPLMALARRPEGVLLGAFEGAPCFAVELQGGEEAVAAALDADTEFIDLRQCGSLLGPEEGGLLAYARAMLFWQRRHRYCGECGHATRSEEAGHLRVCGNPDCDARHFPRTDPAIIVLTTDRSGERALLGRQAVWPEGMYSCLAGFVEPGETLEHAVVREVREEAGVGIERVEYRSSQPWPFPSSLMLGFRAVAHSERITREDEELEDARWFSRDALAEGVRAGRLRVPRRISIAYRLVEEWFDEPGTGSLAELVREP
jgi:NAD+ diphosphatase